jgi:type I restriction enzyme S subunit
MRQGGVALSHEEVSAMGLVVCPAGTMLFPKRGGAIMTEKKRLLERPSCLDLNLMAIVPVADLAPYLWAWLSGVLLADLSDGSNVPQINHGDVDPLAVPLPPLAEQKRIVAEVERRLSAVDGMEAVTWAGLKRAERLRQAILKRAFEGKLVPQDPTDEPASVLLERVTAEWEAQGGPVRGRRGRRGRKEDGQLLLGEELGQR